MLQMCSFIRRIGFILLTALQLSAFSQSYQVTSLSGAAYLPLNSSFPTVHSVDICYDEALSEPILENIFIGFLFNYAGSDYASVRVSSNGFISFVWDGQNLDGKYNNIPTLEVVPEYLTFRGEPILAPFMGDLAGDEQSKALYTRDAGRFIFEWQNWKWNNTRISFEVILYSGTNIIEFRYKDGPALPNNIKIGLLLPNAGFFGPNNPTTISGQAYQFTPNLIAGNKIQGLTFSIFTTETTEKFPWEYANLLKGYPGENGNNMDSVNPIGNGSTNCKEYNHLGYGFYYDDYYDHQNDRIYPVNIRPCNFNGYDYPNIISFFSGSRAFDGELTIEKDMFGDFDMGWRFPNDLFYSMFSNSYVMGYKAQMRGGIIEDYVNFGKLGYRREIFKRYDFNNIAVDDQNYKWFCGRNGIIKYKDNYWSIFNFNGGYISIEKDGTKWIGNNTFVEYSSPIIYKSLNDEDFDLGHIATSGLPVTYTSTNSGVATIVDGKVHIVGLGSTTIETNQAGNAVFKPLPTFRQTLVIKESNIIELDSIAVKTYGDSDFYPLENSSSGLPIAYKCYDSTIVSIVNGKIHIKGVGTCNIYANQKGDEIYGAAKTVRQRLTVNPMPIEVIAQAKQKVYGENDPKLTYNATPNLVNNDSFTGTLSRGFGDNAGSYPIRQGTLSAGDNYSITYQEANFTISKKSLNVKAENKSKNYGEANPELSLSFEGFVNNEDKSVIDALPTIACTATQNSNSGSYPIELSGGSDNNYDLALENGTLQVNPILGTVNTTSIQNITSSTVDVYGDLTSHGGEENIVRGFVYGTSANPTILNSNVEVGSGMGAFSQTINGLTPNVKYYVRSYAYNSVGTVYGNELFFTTLSTGITEPENSEVTIYPNPTTGIVYFKYIDPNAKIEIYNLKGELVQMTEPRDNQISIKNLLTGTYIIKIISDDKIKTIKVVKE